MRKILAGIFLTVALLFSAPTAIAQVPWFKCHASSNHAVGYGWASTPAAACGIALHECSGRTPAHDTCYVRWWIRER